jgi:hypothetical protein
VGAGQLLSCVQSVTGANLILSDLPWIITAASMVQKSTVIDRTGYESDKFEASALPNSPLTLFFYRRPHAKPELIRRSQRPARRASVP